MFSSKSTLDRAFDALIGREIRKLNTHLPKQRKSLSELLKTPDPTIESVDGASILLKTAELEELSRIVPEHYHSDLKLPFIVVRRMDLRKSVYAVSGERLEEFTVKKILGITNLDYREMYRDRDQLYLYRPHVQDLLNRFHSLVVIGFGIPKELGYYGLSRN